MKLDQIIDQAKRDIEDAIRHAHDRFGDASVTIDRETEYIDDPGTGVLETRHTGRVTITIGW